MILRRIFTHPYFSLVAALAVLAAAVSGSIAAYTELRPGAPVIFTLDDAYIHAAMAKNLSQHGVMGINSDAFSSSSSAVLWTLLLALYYRLFGVSSIGPFWLNLVFACLAVWQAWRILRRIAGDRPWLLLGGAVAVVLFTPLAPIVLSGMETAMHILLALVFVDSALQILCPGSGKPGRWAEVRLWAAGALFAFTRYESLALVGFVSVFLVLNRQFKTAGLLAAAALLPITAFGLYSISQGWMFFPNSLMVRSAGGIFSDPLAALPGRLSQLWHEPHLFVLAFSALGGLLVDLRQPLPSPRARLLGGLFILVLMTHVLVDHFGFFYRYEAYVMAMGVLAMAALWGPRIGQADLRSTTGELRALLTGLLIFLALMPLYARGVTALRETPYAMANIHDQQYQMARFLRQYYAGQGVGLHDIGLVSFLSEMDVVDLVGLANRSTARAALAHTSPNLAIDQELAVHHVQVAVIYEGVYLPPGWVRVGTWTLERRVTVGAVQVSFYAANEEEAAVMRAHLLEFAPSLPANVQWRVW